MEAGTMFYSVLVITPLYAQKARRPFTDATV